MFTLTPSLQYSLVYRIMKHSVFVNILKQLPDYSTIILHLDHTPWQCVWVRFSLSLVILPLHLVRVYEIHFKAGLKKDFLYS